jgi:hypothetical protein
VEERWLARKVQAEKQFSPTDHIRITPPSSGPPSPAGRSLPITDALGSAADPTGLAPLGLSAAHEVARLIQNAAGS